MRNRTLLLATLLSSVILQGRIPVAYAATTALSPQSQTANVPLRRPLSPSQPMFLIHVDTWNQPDPQKIIDLIPADVRPFAVLLISLSIDHNKTQGNACVWTQAADAEAVARSWLKTAAQNRMWAMIQPSSGGFSHFPDYPTGTNLDDTVYGALFRDFPNFLGFNYAEQFWGFGAPCAATSQQRWHHWANLLQLTHKYGGLLDVSFTGGYWGASLNPLSMVKSDPTLREALRSYADNFIIEEKHTSSYGYHDNQSTTLGMFLSGFAGHYGIRPDRTGWTNAGDTTYPTAAGAPHLIEHLALTGETVIDGPEIIWLDVIKTMPNTRTSDGYSQRNWSFYPQFENIHLDIDRKILDGTLRLLSRQEVIDRSKLVLLNDIGAGSDPYRYGAPQYLYTGLYLMPGDGTYLQQTSWFKSTGRYPAIPVAWELADKTAQSFQKQINETQWFAYRMNAGSKQAWFNTMFPQEYTGDIFAGRQNNLWITYNPYKDGRTATGNIPFKYNSCSGMSVSYGPYATGMIKEFPTSLDVYLTNYDASTTALKTDTIRISGASTTPSVSYVDRGQHVPSQINSQFADGYLSVAVAHNGPVELTIQCSGNGTNRLTDYVPASIEAPALPPLYNGSYVFEAEDFDVRNIGGIVADGSTGPIGGYQGLGYLNFGTSPRAAIRANVSVKYAGAHLLDTRYSLQGADVGNIAVLVNGVKVATPAFKQTGTLGIWGDNQLVVPLRAGANTIEFVATGTPAAPLYIDNISLGQPR